MHPTRTDLLTILQLKGIRNQRVLQAIENVPREIFIPAEYSHLAYEDNALPIAESQTISQPYVVAEMTSLLIEKNPQKVLEIGTGSGYQAAILAELIPEVYTIERIHALYESAKSCFEQLDITHIYQRYGDGREGWPEKSPFDAIIVTAAATEIPTVLVDQLSDHGRLVIPIGERDDTQFIYVIDKEKDQLKKQRFDAVRFVPLLEGKG